MSRSRPCRTELGLNDGLDLPRVGEDHVGPGRGGRIVEVFPDGAGLEDHVLAPGGEARGCSGRARCRWVPACSGRSGDPMGQRLWLKRCSWAPPRRRRKAPHMVLPPRHRRKVACLHRAEYGADKQQLRGSREPVQKADGRNMRGMTSRRGMGAAMVGGVWPSRG